MDQHQRIDPALGDEPGGDYRLAERRRGGQHAGLVRQHRVRRRLLFGSERAVKADLQGPARVALVADGNANTQIGQCVPNVVQAPSWQADVIRVILGAGDDAWPVVRG